MLGRLIKVIQITDTLKIDFEPQRIKVQSGGNFWVILTCTPIPQLTRILDPGKN